MAETAGMQQARDQPASFQQSEGAAYDIVTNSVRPNMDEKARAVLKMQVL